MKKIIQGLMGLVLALFTVIGIAGGHDDYKVDSKNSSVYFSSIKKQYVVEPAVFKKVTGSMSESGEVEVMIDLNSIDTKVPIRNERLNKLFFDSIKFPEAKVSAKIDNKALRKIKSVGRMSVPASITLYGQSQDVTLDLLVTKTRHHIVVASLSALTVSASDYGIPADNLTKLAATVGGIPISSKVGVSFVLAFEHKH